VAELARVCTHHDDDLDPARVVVEAVSLCATGEARREPLGAGEPWHGAGWDTPSP
jgi:hypothetical protein